MPFEDWAALQRLLIWSADSPKALQPALEALHQALPETALTVLESPARPKSQLNEPLQTVQWLQQHPFDAAIIFSAPNQSPYAPAYLCYLAGIPVRIGQSREFGGQVLSHCFEPPAPLEPVDPHLHLLQAAGLL
ncbi:hypothetical protein [Pseudanabaena sp. FACHB-2040]|uniref:glycosyltransferase family 9 protein n=1 Tax=Pseudanabaena sp. FACHB-2040 TaxID=2692859 RepID=UPI001688ED5D|nr:hypothetical protein [Pseudanabaena sp. FACHB-2040]MBD2257217.1 hypothetical protein [Pseudanabaena sp. FACHB-2040]